MCHYLSAMFLSKWLLDDQVDACMVATGRVPNTKTLGLESMGIETNRGFVQVSHVHVYILVFSITRCLRTSSRTPHIWFII